MASIKIKTLPGTVPFEAFIAHIAPGSVVPLPAGAVVKDGVVTLPAATPDTHRVIAELTVFEARFLAALLGSMTPDDTHRFLTKPGKARKTLADVVDRERTSPKLFHEMDAALKKIGVDVRLDIVDLAASGRDEESFRAGDRVMCAAQPGDAKDGLGPSVGARGVVRRADLGKMILVEWDIPTKGHDEGGYLESERGWYVKGSTLRRDGDFRVGDRVVVLPGSQWDAKMIGKIGTVRCVEDDNQIGVQIDPPYQGGHTLSAFGRACAPEGRGWWLTAKELRLA